MTKRALIQSKFGNRCAYCGEKLKYKNLTLDHVIPKSMGGDRSEGNLYPACRKCNRSKRDLSVEDFRETLGGGLFYFEKRAQEERHLLERLRELTKEDDGQT